MQKIVFLLLVFWLTAALAPAVPPFYQLDFDPVRLNGISAPAMQKLLDQGLSPEYAFVDGSSLLMQAAARSSGEIVRMLLNRGAEANRQDRLGNSAVIYAAMYNPDPTVIVALAEDSALVDQPNFEGATALFYAANLNPSPQVTITLLAAGADPNHTDQQGLSPLIMAATTPLTSQQRDTAEVVSALLQAGANPDSLFNGLNAYGYAERNPALKDTPVPAVLQKALNTGQL